MTYPGSADWSLVPTHMHDGMKLYFDRGVEPGSFMTAVLCNDLKESFGRADDINRERLFDIVRFLWMHAPAPCWGSPDEVRAWIEQGGLDGYSTAAA